MKNLPNTGNRFYWVLAVIILLSVKETSAQTVQKPTDATVSFDSLSTCTFYVQVPDTNAVAMLEIGLGTAPGMTDLLAQTFVYDNSSGLPSGMNWNRTGDKVYLTLGTLTPPAAFFARVRIKNHFGNWSGYYQFLAN
ncbi:MAG TPA: hypothetical protein VFW78_07925 [Bacteroidia bacterium]|nr:hypothetical protein [Bacteroidia bacterium]